MKVARLILFLICHLLLVFSAATGSAQLTNWSVAQGGNGHYYELVVVPGGIRWNLASTGATNRGGYLATATSSNENRFIFTLANQNNSAWVGGFGPWLGGFQPAGSPEPAGGWRWVTGEPFSFQSWAPVQPNNLNGEDRIQFGGNPTNSAAWNDLGETNTPYVRSYVVEYDIHPNAVTLHATHTQTNTIELRWRSRVGVLYSVQWAPALHGASWNLLTNIVGNGATNRIVDPVASQWRMYRVRWP
jgi:hypothetical protein